MIFFSQDMMKNAMIFRKFVHSLALLCIGLPKSKTTSKSKLPLTLALMLTLMSTLTLDWWDVPPPPQNT